MRCLPDRSVVHVEVITDGAHDNLPRVHPGSNLEVESLGPTEFFSIPPDSPVHSQRRIAGPHGMILMGQRRAKQRHNAVAHHLVYGSLIPVHGLHHVFQHRI